MNFNKTVEHVDIQKFMGPWYVWTGRTTFLEKAAYNAVEAYSWNLDKKRIDIDFHFRKGGFDGIEKKIPQKAWIENEKTNAHWKVSPFWPLKFSYLIIALDPDYQWTAVGVPNGSYLWIMGRNPIANDSQIKEIVGILEKLGYPTNDLKRVPQNGK